MDTTIEKLYTINKKSKPESIKEAIQRIKNILDVKYIKTDLTEIIKQYKYLNQIKQNKLLNLLKRFEHFFNGTLGTQRDKSHNIELKSNTQPYYTRWYPVPHCYNKILRIEINRLYNIEMLKK